MAGVGPKFCDRSGFRQATSHLFGSSTNTAPAAFARLSSAQNFGRNPALPSQPLTSAGQAANAQPPAASAFRNPRTAHAENPAASANAIP